jgi:hypothetical protein
MRSGSLVRRIGTLIQFHRSKKPAILSAAFVQRQNQTAQLQVNTNLRLDLNPGQLDKRSQVRL